jgi:hypothetical protein
VEVLPGVALSQPGGHFPGSAIVHWAPGAEGRGDFTIAIDRDAREVVRRSADRHVAWLRGDHDHLT